MMLSNTRYEQYARWWTARFTYPNVRDTWYKYLCAITETHKNRTAMKQSENPWLARVKVRMINLDQDHYLRMLASISALEAYHHQTSNAHTSTYLTRLLYIDRTTLIINNPNESWNNTKKRKRIKMTTDNSHKITSLEHTHTHAYILESL